MAAPSMNFIPSSFRAISTPGKKSDVMPMASSSAPSWRSASPCVQAGDPADFGIVERRAEAAQVPGGHAHIAVADGEEVVARFADRPARLRNLIVATGK